MIAAAEGLAAEPGNETRAAALLDRALAMDPRQPHAFALRAAIEVQQNKPLNAAAIEALRQSFLSCPFCEKELLKWRLEFVLQHWKEVPEDIRIMAFQGADVLRWWHLDYEYLEEIMLEAEAEGIPFSAYRQKVGTRVRPEEIAAPKGD